MSLRAVKKTLIESHVRYFTFVARRLCPPNIFPLSCKPPKRPTSGRTAARRVRRGSGAVGVCVGGTPTTTASPEGLQPRASVRRLASFCGESGRRALPATVASMTAYAGGFCTPDQA